MQFGELRTGDGRVFIHGVAVELADDDPAIPYLSPVT